MKLKRNLTILDLRLFYLQYPGSSVGSDAGCEFEPLLGQHSFRRLTKVTVSSVIPIQPMGQQSTWKSSQLFDKTVEVLSTDSKETHEWVNWPP